MIIYTLTHKHRPYHIWTYSQLQLSKALILHIFWIKCFLAFIFTIWLLNMQSTDNMTPFKVLICLSALSINLSPSSDVHTHQRKCTHIGKRLKQTTYKVAWNSYKYHHIYKFVLHIYSHSCPGQYEHIYNRRLIHENNLFMNLHHAFKQQWDTLMKNHELHE